MSRLVRRRVEVLLNWSGTEPGLFRDPQRDFHYWIVCEVLQVWKRGGRWWMGEPEATVYRVRAERPGELLYAELVKRGAKWMIERIHD